jgi:hypothetical protein
LIKSEGLTSEEFSNSLVWTANPFCRHPTCRSPRVRAVADVDRDRRLCTRSRATVQQPDTGLCRLDAVSEPVRAAEDAGDAAEADAAWDEPGQSIPLDELEAEVGR